MAPNTDIEPSHLTACGRAVLVLRPTLPRYDADGSFGVTSTAQGARRP